MGYAKQIFDNGHEGHQDDQIIGSHLDHRIGRISLGQSTPDKDHGSAGSGPQEYGSCQILGSQVPGNESLEHLIKEEGGQAVHGKGFDQPVGDPGDKKSLGMPAHFPDALEIHLHHHGVDHDPDQDGNGNGNPVNLHPVQEPGNRRQEMAHQYTGRHTKENPQGKIPLERADARIFDVRHFAATPFS